MVINCSAGKGIMTSDACLACALQGNPPCGYDYTVLKMMYGGNQQEARSTSIHVTDLTGCLMRAYLDKTTPVAEYPHEGLARTLGSAIHAHLEGTDEVLTSEMPLHWDGLVGTADVVYKDGRVVDFKTTRWLVPSKVPYGSHELQVNIYAYMLKKSGMDVKQLQIQYIDTSGPTKCRKCKVPVRMIEGELRCPKCFQIIANAHLGAVLVDVPLADERDIEKFIRDRKEVLDAALKSGIPPEAEPGWLCSYCAHYGVSCFPD